MGPAGLKEQMSSTGSFMTHRSVYRYPALQRDGTSNYIIAHKCAMGRKIVWTPREPGQKNSGREKQQRPLLLQTQMNVACMPPRQSPRLQQLQRLSEGQPEPPILRSDPDTLVTELTPSMAHYLDSQEPRRCFGAERPVLCFTEEAARENEKMLYGGGGDAIFGSTVDLVPSTKGKVSVQRYNSYDMPYVRSRAALKAVIEDERRMRREEKPLLESHMKSQEQVKSLLHIGRESHSGSGGASRLRQTSGQGGLPFGSFGPLEKAICRNAMHPLTGAKSSSGSSAGSGGSPVRHVSRAKEDREEGKEPEGTAGTGAEAQSTLELPGYARMQSLYSLLEGTQNGRIDHTGNRTSRQQTEWVKATRGLEVFADGTGRFEVIPPEMSVIGRMNGGTTTPGGMPHAARPVHIRRAGTTGPNGAYGEWFVKELVQYHKDQRKSQGLATAEDDGALVGSPSLDDRRRLAGEHRALLQRGAGEPEGGVGGGGSGDLLGSLFPKSYDRVQKTGGKLRMDPITVRDQRTVSPTKLHPRPPGHAQQKHPNPAAQAARLDAVLMKHVSPKKSRATAPMNDRVGAGRAESTEGNPQKTNTRASFFTPSGEDLSAMYALVGATDGGETGSEGGTTMDGATESGNDSGRRHSTKANAEHNRSNSGAPDDGLDGVDEPAVVTSVGLPNSHGGSSSARSVVVASRESAAGVTVKESAEQPLLNHRRSFPIELDQPSTQQIAQEIWEQRKQREHESKGE